MNRILQWIQGDKLKVFAVVAILLVGLLLSVPTKARASNIYFWVNSDSTKVTMVQGDSLAWGANCGVGAKLLWEIWYDVNANLAINPATDALVDIFVAADGDTNSNAFMPDINPIPDGFYKTPTVSAGIGDGIYLFRLTDSSDNSVATKSMTVAPLNSAPNSFSGTLLLPGHPAPDPSFLSNKWVQADVDEGSQIWSDFSNDSGKFTIRVGSAGTGLTFRISPPDFPGFVTPVEQSAVAGGHATLPNFNYVVATDSVYGTVKDDLGNDLDGRFIHASPQFGGAGKDTRVANGHYTLYFGPSERGVWWIGISQEQLIPDYMVPTDLAIDNTSNHSIQFDIVCPRTDTTVYVRVTENGGLPVHPYHVLVTQIIGGVFTDGYTGSGAGNIVPIPVSHLWDTGWYAQIVSWDPLFPIPPDLVLDGSEAHSFNLGDTLTFNFVSGHKVSDTITVDPGDALPNWDSVWVGLCNLEGCKIASVNSSGVYTVYGDTGEYSLGAFAQMYLAYPSSIDLHLLSDTSGGLGFELNRTHCRVHGTLTNVQLPLMSPTWIIGFESGTGLTTSTQADPMTGDFSLYLSDGDWSIAPPIIPGRTAPGGAFLTVFEWPDSARLQNFAYTIPSDVGEDNNDALPTSFALGQNYPNPFNPTTTISYDLPKPSEVTLTIYNLLGQEVTTLVSGMVPAGRHTVTWNGQDRFGRPVASAVYLYKMQAGDFVETKKMVYLK